MDQLDAGSHVGEIVPHRVPDQGVMQRDAQMILTLTLDELIKQCDDTVARIDDDYSITAHFARGQASAFRIASDLFSNLGLTSEVDTRADADVDGGRGSSSPRHVPLER